MNLACGYKCATHQHFYLELRTNFFLHRYKYQIRSIFRGEINTALFKWKDKNQLYANKKKIQQQSIDSFNNNKKKLNKKCRSLNGSIVHRKYIII